MWRCLPLMLVACTTPTARVAGVVVQLHTPAAVDPLDGASVLVVRIIDEAGAEVERVEGAPDQGLPVPPITWFGPQEIEVTARAADGTVLAAARTGLIDVQPGDESNYDLLFLPVNTAVKLDWTPNADRIGHLALPDDDGRILLIGGRQPSSSVARTDSEWWSMVTGFDGEGPRITDGMSHPTWAELPDGGYLIAGGDTQGGASNAVFSLTEARDDVRDLDPLARAITTPCVAAHPSLDGVVLGAGIGHTYSSLGRTGTLSGFDTTGIETCGATADFMLTVGDASKWGVFDLREVQGIDDLPGVVRWLPEVPTLEGAHVLPLPDGRFWVGGGFGFAASTSTRLITPRGLEEARGPDLDDFRVGGDVGLWREEYVVLGGGFSDQASFTPVRSLVVHHPDEGHQLTIPVPLRNPTMAIQRSGAVVFTGGLDEANAPAGAWAVIPWIAE